MLRRFEFDYDFINKGRLQLEPFVFENINKNNLDSLNRLLKSQTDTDLLRRGSYVMSSTLYCNKDWPLCIYDLNYKNKIVMFFIISIGEKPNIIENYFFKNTRHNLGMVELPSYNFKKEEEEIENKEEFKYIPFKKLIIERRVHKCNDEVKENTFQIERKTIFEKLEKGVHNSKKENEEKLDIDTKEIDDILADIDLKSKQFQDLIFT